MLIALSLVCGIVGIILVIENNRLTVGYLILLILGWAVSIPIGILAAICYGGYWVYHRSKISSVLKKRIL